jgi:nuclear transport factor 2 (NTF2) superfamily protein
VGVFRPATGNNKLGWRRSAVRLRWRFGMLSHHDIKKSRLVMLPSKTLCRWPKSRKIPMPASVPPFTRESAILKVRLAEDAWNSRDPHRVSLAYTEDSRWRNRSEFINGRAEIVDFLTRKWAKELNYRLIKEMWTFDENRIAVRFAYEWHDDSGNWFRSYGNENWEFNAAGEMQRRMASINDLPISEADRQYHWPLGRRPEGHPGLSDLGL